MAYLIAHHGSYWFQIRVPQSLVPRYGAQIRQNLQTTERALAQSLAYQLASHWLSRFALERGLNTNPSLYGEFAASEPELSRTDLDPVNQHASPTVITPMIDKDAMADSDSFEELLLYWKKLHPECSPSTYKEVASIVKDVKRVLHRRPSELKRTEVAAYRDKLITAGLSRATVAKKISFIGTLLQTAVDAGILEHNVARGLRIPKPKVQRLRRRAFTPDELKAIFCSPVYRDRRRYRGSGGEAAVWVPAIALATGARLEEICQLQIRDIFHDEANGPMLRITDDGDGQRVKTMSSRRTLPIHPSLVHAGLLEYWQLIKEEGQDWLFPELDEDHDGRRGANWGKWFNRYLRSRNGCGICDRRVVFHSFRHTFKTLCRDALLAEEIHDALTGHTSSSVGRGYGHVPVSAMAEAIARINLPIALPRIEY